MSKLELILLGRFECLLPSGTRISLTMRKAEVLLAYLALTPGLRHPRERLINLLWSDRGEEQARNSLRQCLSAIRKSLGEVADMVLQVDRTSVSLIPELIDIDVHEFERLAESGDYESLITAADLYQGEFLEGISIRDAACQGWLDGERSRFKRQSIEILARLTETQLLSHDYGHAIKSAERLVIQDPLGESGWQLLMRAYFDSGDRSHALQAFKRCQQALRDELDVEPEAATIELRDRIAGGEAKAESAPASVVSKPPVDSPASTDHSIAVLPFDNLSGDPEQEYFSDGITDSIILHLSLFPGLNIKSRNSSFAFKQQIKSLGEISQELEVDYIVEGSIRKSDQHIRITVQLIDATSGNQVWGKRYDADLSDLFTLEEELSRAIAATVTGQIESDLQRIAIAKGANSQDAYDLLLSGTYHSLQFTPQDTVIAIEKLNQCLLQDPDNVRAHAMLYFSHNMDYLGRWTENHQLSFRKSGEHIRRALELDPGSSMVHAFYGEFLAFSGEYDKAETHLDKALEINPNNPDAITIQALGLESKGDFEASLKAAEHALSLDPYHPWAKWELGVAQYLCGHYEAALETIAKLRTSPGFIRLFIIASNIKLDRIDLAREAFQELMRECRETMLSMPQTIDQWLQYTRENYPFSDPGINQDLIDCLLQAGLEEEMVAAQKSADPEALPSILVLPFSNLSGDPEQEYFSDGISESIIVNLSSFSGLNVKSRHTSFAFKNSAKSIGEIAAELGVKYIVEGSIRKFGDKIRITVQVDETASGNQLWGKRFESELEDLFALEEELVKSITGSIGGRIGKDIKSVSMHKSAKDLKSYDYLMRGVHHLEKFNAEDVAIARRQFQTCLEHDPDNSEAHAMLAVSHLTELLEHWSVEPSESKDLMMMHAENALQLEPENPLAHAFMAEALMYLGDFERAENHVERALELNPNLPDGYSIKCSFLASTQRLEQALEYADMSLQIDPHHFYMCWNAGEVYQQCGQFELAIKTFRSMPHMPPSVHAQIAASLAGLGKMDEARAEMQRYLESARGQMPNCPANEKEWRSYWYEYTFSQDEGDFETFFQLLLKAGLCDDSAEPRDAIPSIAVLPFENMSGDPEQEHFSDGITADIISTLSKFRHLRTISRYSTQQYKTQKLPIADIAQQQNARYILEGSVRKSGDRIRVNAELIDSVDGQICWNERYDRDLDDLFAVQDEINRHIALAMKVQLDDGDMALHRSKGATDIKAWELVMTAVDLQDTYIRQNIVEARVMVNEAIKLDPAYAYAWVALAWTYWQEAYSGWSESIGLLIDEAENANRQAMQLDPDYGEVWSQAGTNHIMRHEPEQAIEACSNAVELEPGNAEVQALAAFACIFKGDYEQGHRHYQNVLKLCPIRPNWYYLIGAQLEKIVGNLDRAAEIYQQGIDVEPDSPLCRFYLIDVMCDKGDQTSAHRLADEVRALDKEVTGRGLVQAYSYDQALRDRFQANLAQFDLF